MDLQQNFQFYDSKCIYLFIQLILANFTRSLLPLDSLEKFKSASGQGSTPRGKRYRLFSAIHKLIDTRDWLVSL